MLLRFCLYGFLKNQRYFEPFLVLVFLGKGLSFFDIGSLIGFRELVVNLVEVPSGAVADLWGRRRSLMLSFSAYIVSFLIFHQARTLAWLFLAMAFFGVGEAFRSGTHKAVIFDWLKAQGRGGEKAAVYGTTRSWSQVGSAISVVIAVVIVLVDGGYQRVFLFAVIPYGLGLINFFGYPEDPPYSAAPSWGRLLGHLVASFRQALGQIPVRRLLGESMLQRGTYVTTKDYLQPVLEATAIGLPLLAVSRGVGSVAGSAAAAADPLAQRTALLVGAVYFVLHLLSAIATRRAHRVERRLGGPVATARWIWRANLLLFALLVPSLLGDWNLVIILAFVALSMLQNLWKPLFLARIDEVSDDALGATLLSIDSQAKALFVLPAAPLLGWGVDHFGLVAVAWAGVATAMLGWWVTKRH